MLKGWQPALRAVVWSTSVQHGPENRIIDRAIANVDKTMKRDDPRFERSVIEAVYAERGRQDAKGGLVYSFRSPANWSGLEARFKAEGAEAVKRFDAEVKPRWVAAGREPSSLQACRSRR